MKISFILITLLTLISCTTLRLIPVVPTQTEILAPSLNEVKQSELGESLIRAEKGKKFKGILMTDDIILQKSPPNSTNLKSKTLIFKDVPYTLKNQTNEYELYSMDGSEYGIALPKNGGDGWVYKNTLGSISIMPNKNLVKYKSVTIPDKNYSNQEFIYNGKIGTGIKFSYREFTDDMARPAFTQDLQYDLSESDTIGFKGMRIKVINAQNTKIEYKILSYFK